MAPARGGPLSVHPKTGDERRFASDYTQQKLTHGALKLGVSKNRGVSPKMDGENNGKPYFLMDDLGGYPTIFGNIQMMILEDDLPFNYRDFFRVPAIGFWECIRHPRYTLEN